MSNSPPYDLVIGLDRSDKKADLHLITTATGQRRSVVIDTAPEALWERQCYHHVFGIETNDQSRHHPRSPPLQKVYSIRVAKQTTRPR